MRPSQKILRHVPQRSPEDRWPDARPRPMTRPSANAETWEKVIRKLRTGAMPPAGAPHPSQAASDTLADVPRSRNGSRRAGRPQSREARARPSAEPHRIPERDPRSAGHRGAAERDRLHAAAADRQLVERVRQPRRPAVRVAGDHGTLPRRGGKDQPPRGGGHEGAGAGQSLPAASRTVAGRPRGRAAVGDARRPLRAEPLPRRRRVRIQVQLAAPPAEPHQLEISVDGERAQIVTIGGNGARTRPPRSAAEDRRARARQGPRVPHRRQSRPAAHRRHVHRAR